MIRLMKFSLPSRLQLFSDLLKFTLRLPVSTFNRYIIINININILQDLIDETSQMSAIQKPPVIGDDGSTSSSCRFMDVSKVKPSKNGMYAWILLHITQFYYLIFAF